MSRSKLTSPRKRAFLLRGGEIAGVWGRAPGRAASGPAKRAGRAKRGGGRSTAAQAPPPTRSVPAEGRGEGRHRPTAEGRGQERPGSNCDPPTAKAKRRRWPRGGAAQPLDPAEPHLTPPGRISGPSTHWRQDRGGAGLGLGASRYSAIADPRPGMAQVAPTVEPLTWGTRNAEAREAAPDALTASLGGGRASVRRRENRRR